MIDKICVMCGKSFRVKNRRKHTAKCCSVVCRGKYVSKYNVGENAKHWQGKTIKVHCAQCNKIFEKPVCRSTRIYCSNTCRGIASRKTFEEKSNRDLLRTWQEYVEFRKQIYKRDNYTCQICFERGGVLNMHHIFPVRSYFELAVDPMNVITLCVSCHAKTIGQESLWEDMCFSILDKNYYAQKSTFAR